MGAIIRSLVMVVTLSIFTGLVYPLAMTGLAQVVFPSRANGSIIIKDGVPVRAANGRTADQEAPSVLVTNSSSGVDPHLTPAAAYCQVERIAKVRGLEIRQVRDLVTEHIENADLGVVGEDRGNVLILNLALDNLQQNQ